MSLEILARLAAVFAGGAIGLGFGMVQQGALRRYSAAAQNGG